VTQSAQLSTLSKSQSYPAAQRPAPSWPDPRLWIAPSLWPALWNEAGNDGYEAGGLKPGLGRVAGLAAFILCALVIITAAVWLTKRAG